ncbi:MAG: type II toxin-antitoxin system RelE/ParE family toxin [Propionibacteriaceae bacterium]|nr:type II toxin-antitoxin system RelE/ParE family toxin [Propionibacteriaceae bacterium]
MVWLIELDDAVQEWMDSLDAPTYKAVMAAVVVLGREGPSLGRPLVDSITGSRIANLKELRPSAPGRQSIRLLFVFDPVRSAFFLVGGDKSGDWDKWYKRNIPVAERRYAAHLRELETRKEQR